MPAWIAGHPGDRDVTLHVIPSVWVPAFPAGTTNTFNLRVMSATHHTAADLTRSLPTALGYLGLGSHIDLRSATGRTRAELSVAGDPVSYANSSLQASALTKQLADRR